MLLCERGGRMKLEMLLWPLLFMVVFVSDKVHSSEPKIIPWNIPDNLVARGKVKLMCSVSKGSHPIKFEWLINRHNLYETGDIFVQNLEDASILNIKNLQLIHNSNISCVATNRFGKDVYESFLTVNAPPQWVKKPPETLNLKENESSQSINTISIDCVANGFPSPKIQWQKISSTNKNSNSEQILKSMPNGTLLIDVQKADEGDYMCTVDNKIGERLISKTKLIVQTPPKVSMIDNQGKELNPNEQTPINYARKGESFSVRCQATGDQPITIDWYKNSELMQYKFSSNMETISSPSPSGLMSELHFRSIGRSDSALYECRAKNSLGEAKRIQKLVVLEPPEAPKDLVISDLDSTSVRLNWQLSFNGNLELTKINIYFWESNNKHKQTGNHKLNKVVIDLTTSTWHVLKSLKSGTGYTLAVTCENRIGESALSELVEFETKMKNPYNPPTDLTIHKVFSNRILISWKYSAQERQTANVTGFQVFYKPVDEQNYFIERMTVRDSVIEMPREQFQLTLVNLRKNTKYVIKVKSYNKEGFSPDSEEIECVTLRGNVPNAPRITSHQVHAKSYLILKWEHSNIISNPTLNAALRHEDSSNNDQQHLVPKTSNDDETNSLQDYENTVQMYMAYVEVSDLKMIVQTIPIPSTVRQVTIANLDKDVQYNIYVSAINQFGESEMSEPLMVTIRSYQYEMSIFIAERNALIVTAISIGATAILVSIICSIIYMKKFQKAQQEKLRKMSTLTLSKCGTNKTTATYATIGNAPTNSSYTAQHAQLTPIHTSAAYMTANHQQPCSSGGYQEIGLTYDLATGGLSSNATKLSQTPHHHALSTFGQGLTIRSDASNTQSSADEDHLHALQVKDRFRQSNKSLNSIKNMRINYDECIYDDALG